MKRIVLLLASVASVVLLAFGIALVLAADPVKAELPPKNGKIGYVDRGFYGSSSGQIKTMNPDGSDQKSLSTPVYAESLAWSPDGAKIAYSAYSGFLYTANADGTNQTFITGSEGEEATYGCATDPAWSPDGTKIAFRGCWWEKTGENSYSVRHEIYTINVNGTGKTNLTNTVAVNEGSPAWSADGTKIAYVSEGEIKVMNSDGSAPSSLSMQGTYVRDLDWSRDSSKIAFSDGFHVYTINPNGSGQRNLTSTLSMPYQAEAINPAWSPDGTKIAFQVRAPICRGCSQVSSDIYTINADGTQSSRLSGEDTSKVMPAWQPNVTPPAPVTSFAATAADRQVVLSWNNPNDPYYGITRILRSASAYATDAHQQSGQTNVYEGSASSFTDKGLINGTTYYYTAFVKDKTGRWSNAAKVSVKPIPVKPTTLTLSSSNNLVEFNGQTTLTGKLSTSAGPVPEEKPVRVQRSTNGGSTWQQDGEAFYNANSKTYMATRSLTANAIFRLRFAGDSFFTAATSPNVLVKARAYLTQPRTPDSVKKSSAFTVSGFLEPRHSGTTRLYFYRYAQSKWQLYEYKDARNADYDATTTRYALRYKALKAGQWQVKARHKDASHATTWSPARNFAVRR